MSKEKKKEETKTKTGFSRNLKDYDFIEDFKPDMVGKFAYVVNTDSLGSGHGFPAFTKIKITSVTPASRSCTGLATIDQPLEGLTSGTRGRGSRRTGLIYNSNRTFYTMELAFPKQTIDVLKKEYVDLLETLKDLESKIKFMTENKLSHFSEKVFKAKQIVDVVKTTKKDDLIKKLAEILGE